MPTTKREILADTYWSRVFVPALLILLALAFILLFLLPQTQLMSTPSVYKALRSFQTIKSP